MENNGYITRKMFYWIMGTLIGIIMLVFTSVMSYTIGKVDDISDKFNHNFTEVTSNISSINTSLEFIIEDIKEIKEKI